MTQGKPSVLVIQSIITFMCLSVTSPEVDEDDAEDKQAEIDSLRNRIHELEEEIELERMKYVFCFLV